MDLIEYLETRHGWHATHETPYRLTGLCPYHTEHTPSFHIDVRETPPHFFCFGCRMDGTGLFGIVKWLEFGGNNTPDTLKAVAARVRALGGDSQSSYVQKGITHPKEWEPDLLPLPTDEQQHVMTVAHSWWRTQLWQNGSKDIRTYLVSRGLKLDFVEAVGRVGYAPWCGEQTNAYRALCRTLAEQCGANWQQVAKQVGILTTDGQKHARMHHRLMFAQIADTASSWGQGPVQLILGRAMKSENKCKWLLSPGLRKVPFSIPIAHPIITGTTIVEGPIEALVLAQPQAGYSGIEHAAQIGNSTMPMCYLKTLTPPIFIGTNHDPLHLIKHTDGRIEWIRPGEQMAQAIAKRLLKEGIPHMRVQVPTEEMKDIDKFILLAPAGIWSWVDRYPADVAIAI